MPNTYVNKVTANGQTLIDLTADTALAADVAQGKYFHLATGERVVGTASGSGGDSYTLTTVVPQQTFTPQNLDGSYQTTVNFTAGIEDGEPYLVTFDGEQYLCMCGVMWGSDYMAGKESLFWGDRGDSPYPFGLDYVPSVPEFGVGTYDLDSHTIKIEHIEFVDGPSGGGSNDVVTGTLTVASDVKTSIDITDTTEIGFTPTKFILYTDNPSTVGYAIGSSTYVKFGNYSYRSYAYYDGQSSSFYTSAQSGSWTTRSSGCLYFANGQISFVASTTRVLKAGTYSWIAIR